MLQFLVDLSKPSLIISNLRDVFKVDSPYLRFPESISDRAPRDFVVTVLDVELTDPLSTAPQTLRGHSSHDLTL